MDKTPEQIAADEAAAAAAAAEAAKAEKTVEARVLSACEYGNPNDVANVPASRLKDAKAAGLVDDNKAAVAYAKSLQAAKA
jgi:hypothetical protein